MMAVQGTKNFGSEKLMAYELGYRHQFTPQESIDIAGFFNDYSQLRDLSFDTIRQGTGIHQHLLLPILFNNQGSAHAYGGEVSIDWRPIEQWRLQGNYSYQEITVNSNVTFYNIKDDVTMAWKPVQNVEFFLVGQNLFSQNHRESQSDFIHSVATRIPRGIYVGGRWHF